ncbi:MAG: extracellular solute-binding protein [Cyanobacteria bacterium RYN_339]|nr:extracellular solute-binding protein [Cyanobacteria bacterium RYN_339]
MSPSTRSLVLVLALLCCGCPRGHEAAGGRIPIRFSGYAGNPAETNLMEKLVKDFNTSQTEITVSYEPVPGQYYPKMLTMLVSKTAPDVFYLDVLQFKPFLAKHVLKPLTPFLVSSATTKKADFLPTLWNSFAQDDQQWGIPKDFNCLALFYNTKMFDEAKVPYPDASWDLPRVREAAKALTTPAHAGFCMSGDELARYMPVAWNYGAQLFNPDGHCGLGGPQAVEALGWYTGFRNQDKTGVLPSEVGSSWPGDVFGRQGAAMVFEGGWLVPYMAETFPKVDYGVTELPKGPAGSSNMLFTVSYVIPESCQHPDAAWKVIEYLTSEASQAQVTFALPSRRAEADKYAAARPKYQPILKGAEYARPYEFGARGDRIKDRVGVAMQEVFLGVKGPQQALKDAADDIDLLVKL